MERALANRKVLVNGKHIVAVKETDEHLELETE